MHTSLHIWAFQPAKMDSKGEYRRSAKKWRSTLTGLPIAHANTLKRGKAPGEGWLWTDRQNLLLRPPSDQFWQCFGCS